jgi:hypothetical protein
LFIKAEKPIEPAMPSSASTNQPISLTTTTTTTAATATATATATEDLQESPAINEQALSQSSSSIPTEDQPSQHIRAVQLNKARCFRCKAKIPLAKQTINRCRCGEYYFLIFMSNFNSNLKINSFFFSNSFVF